MKIIIIYNTLQALMNEKEELGIIPFSFHKSAIFIHFTKHKKLIRKLKYIFPLRKSKFQK